MSPPSLQNFFELSVLNVVGFFFNKIRLIRESKEYQHFVCILKLIIPEKGKKSVSSHVPVKKILINSLNKGGPLDFYNFD